MVGDRQRNDLALPVYGNSGALSQIPARIFHASVPVELSELKLLDQFVLNRAARKDAHKNVARALKSEHSARDPSEACRSARERGRRHCEALRLVAIRRHKASHRFIARRDQKREERTGQEPKKDRARQRPSMLPEKLQVHERTRASL